jgi:hypothetical protein
MCVFVMRALLGKEGPIHENMKKREGQRSGGDGDSSPAQRALDFLSS